MHGILGYMIIETILVVAVLVICATLSIYFEGE